MTLGETLAMLRKQHNFTQEQLADQIGVSRQSISKWESDLCYPDTKNIAALGRLYNCSLDFLLSDDAEAIRSKGMDPGGLMYGHTLNYEYRSKCKLFGLPLVHVSFGLGKTAKGIIAIGTRARGVFSFGILSVGLFSFGTLSLGLFSIGAVAAGLISLGAIAGGIIAFGSIALGLWAFGGLAAGLFSAGALAAGKYFAIGLLAKGNIAIGDEKFSADVFGQRLSRLTYADKQFIIDSLNSRVPWVFKWCIAIVKLILGL